MATAKDALRALGLVIRARRESRGYTQSELGNRAGIVGKYVSEIERGTRDIPFSTLHAIVEDGLAQHLDVRFGHSPTAPGRRAKVALPRPVEEVARQIAELSPDLRTMVLGIVRQLLRVANR
ncbi:hypothetical protein BH11MYX1_BH11MYX1_03490 [soil metagenome]